MCLNDEEIMPCRLRRSQVLRPRRRAFPKGLVLLFGSRQGQVQQGRRRRRQEALAETKYDGTPIRILNSKQYDFHNRMALAMAEQMKEAGFKVQLGVVDWATLVQRRNDPALWDIYITHAAFLPRAHAGAARSSAMARPAGGRTPAKDATLAAFNGEADAAKRGVLGARCSRPSVRRGALYPPRQLRRPAQHLGQDEGFHADALAGLLERRPGRLSAQASFSRRPFRTGCGRA